MTWNAKAYIEARRTAEGLPPGIDMRRLVSVAGTPEGRRAVLDEISNRIRRVEGAQNVNLMEPHMSFNDYATDDETAHPCRCWIAGRENRGVNATDCLHPDEYLDGVQTRYEYENDI